MLKLMRSIKCNSNIRTYKTDNVRVRFAPSPTGYLHLGGLRTALYNFLFAKKYNGKFILRIEDTDQTRLVPDAIQQLQNDLNWSGIEIDEGPSQGGCFGPYIQSSRLSVYREHVHFLLDKGLAYHCFCSDRRLQLLRREALRAHEIPKYDNRCRELSLDEVKTKLDKGEVSCIRFKVEQFNDLIYGDITYNVSLNEGDPVIIKSDGYPTYHFANVVDDHLMKITHVLRGVEWQISTIKHVLLYRAFNWNPPLFGHLPLLMNADGTKLSKRQGDIKISHYRENNIFPLAMINFIAHSGGGFSKDLERHLKPRCYSIGELVNQFDLTRIKSHSGKLMMERLLEFNRHELKRRLHSVEEEHNLILQVKELVQNAFCGRVLESSLQLNQEYIRNILHWAVNRIDKLSDIVSKDLEFIWVIPTELKIEEPDMNAVELFKAKLENEEELSEKNSLNTFLKNFCEENKIKFSNFMKLLRSVLSGLKEGPGVAEMIVILGKKNTLRRLETCLNKSKGIS
ncbi:probable glutamate--tRNA ligase, mitochondrial isoform X2 [Anoplophora glabripennis]|uniref:probable glutamate--tRNA ligase, mitochondrial isoform X2 n=1 Tax=Anoplophora glabripennis TaxID=217634 RepID=UPI000875523E|nr:probable glutamate--tRNA ligase, mitochondrial isoform X2 [Anoplophora glabripennis]